jgi:hypothetical protein
MTKCCGCCLAFLERIKPTSHQSDIQNDMDLNLIEKPTAQQLSNIISHGIAIINRQNQYCLWSAVGIWLRVLTRLSRIVGFSIKLRSMSFCISDWWVYCSREAGLSSAVHAIHHCSSYQSDIQNDMDLNLIEKPTAQQLSNIISHGIAIITEKQDSHLPFTQSIIVQVW